MARVLWVLAVFSACASTSFREGTVRKPQVRYSVGQVSAAWTLVRVSETDLAYLAKSSSHSLAVNATCEGHDDPPLEALTQHLLIGFTDRELVAEEKMTIDGRAGHRSHYKATLDGVPVELAFVVAKKDGCVYDFTYLAPVGRFAEHLQDFEALWQAFHAEER
ncbi:MAG: hypothetical protein ACKVPX_16985 [Myxococcaceae bacterium]